MRLRYCLFPFALLICCHVPAAAQAQTLEEHAGMMLPFFAPPEEVADAVTPRTIALPTPHPSPLTLKGKNTLYRAAYTDTYHILSTRSACSDFFGGGAFAIEVFNDLAAQLKTDHMNTTSVGMMMTGNQQSVVKTSTGQTYRLFARALLNSNGPFFRDKNSTVDRANVPRVGSFAPNTRAARVLILLHELAHLIRRPDGNWLIPNDGNSIEQSERNTALVESVCGTEIKALAEN
jgi:hypothetical protein